MCDPITFTNRKIIGLCGKKRSGKDTLAKMFPEFTPIAFADALWKVLLAADPWIDSQDVEGNWEFDRLSYWNERYGYEGCKTKFPEVRRLMQKLGTEGVRENIGNETWINVVRNTLRNDPNTNYVVTDIRFDNEAQLVQAYGGIVVKLERENTESDEHISESIQAIHHDVLYINNGDLNDLESFAKDLLRRY